MLSGDCNTCINGKLPSYSATCVECGLSRKNFKAITNGDAIRAMTDEELADNFSLWCCRSTTNDSYCESFGTCDKCWLDWLKEEAKDGEQS